MRCVHCLRADSNYMTVSMSSKKEAQITHKRHNLSRVLLELVCEFVIVDNKMGHVDIAIILLYQHILANLVSTKELEGTLTARGLARACR